MRNIKRAGVLLLVVTMISQPVFIHADEVVVSAEPTSQAEVIFEEKDVVPEDVVVENALSLEPETVPEVIDLVNEVIESDSVVDVMNEVRDPDTMVTTTPNVVNLAVTDKNLRSIDDAQARAVFEREYEDIVPVSGEVIVRYKNRAVNLNTSKGKKEASRFALANSLMKKDDIGDLNVSVLRIGEEKMLTETMEEIARDPRVESVQPNYKYEVVSIDTNDTEKDMLWALDNIGQAVEGHSGVPDADMDMPEAWSISEGGNAPVIVAVIDSGVAYNHADLASNMWDGTNCKDENGVFLGGCNHGYDYEDGDVTPLPTQSTHGTHVAGIIGAEKNNGMGTIGIAPNVEIMAIKTSFTTFELLQSISFAKHNGAHIINASWGGVADTEDLLLKDAIAGFPGLFVAAAGNSATNNDDSSELHFYPSDYDLPNIISVAATDQDDNLASFSNYGGVSVDVAAPGTNILSTVPMENIYEYREDFDGVITPGLPPQWTASGTSSWGTYDHGGLLRNVLYGDLAYPYADNQNNVIISDSYALVHGTEATMSFLTACDTEYSGTDYFDYMQLGFSADGVNFTEDGITLTWDEGLLDTLNGESPMSSDGNAFYYFSDIVIPSVYATENFAFQFRWVTNGVDSNYDGCFIDQIEIYQSSIVDGETYEYKEGTSMATPHVTGIAALIKGYDSTLTSSQIKDIILSTGDSLPSISGKTVSGKRVNAYNALQTVGAMKLIESFAIPSQVGDTQIDALAHTITLTMPANADITNLVPVIDFHGATISPEIGVAVDFTLPVTYTVTALDGSQVEYVVTVAKQAEIEEPALQRSSGGGGGGGGSKSKKTVKVVPKATPVVSETVNQVVNENIIAPVSQNRFTQTIALGARGNDVIELQKILIAGKYLMVNPPTGYYGPLTATAVRAYQKAHSLPMTGVVDTQTLAVLNGLSTTTADSKAQLILLLMEKLKALQLQLAALQQ